MGEKNKFPFWLGLIWLAKWAKLKRFRLQSSLSTFQEIG